MHLEDDCFTITYDASKVSVAAIMEKIRALGYRPEEVGATKPTANDSEREAKPLPELVAVALEAATKADKLLLIDFFAGWCAPCKVLENRVLVDDEVMRALTSYHLVKVDTDRYPEVAEYFKIRALPTLIVLDKESIERFRHLGLIDADALVRELKSASKAQGPD